MVVLTPACLAYRQRDIVSFNPFGRLEMEIAKSVFLFLAAGLCGIDEMKIVFAHHWFLFSNEYRITLLKICISDIQCIHGTI